MAWFVIVVVNWFMILFGFFAIILCLQAFRSILPLQLNRILPAIQFLFNIQTWRPLPKQPPLLFRSVPGWFGFGPWVPIFILILPLLLSNLLRLSDLNLLWKFCIFHQIDIINVEVNIWCSIILASSCFFQLILWLCLVICVILTIIFWVYRIHASIIALVLLIRNFSVDFRRYVRVVVVIFTYYFLGSILVWIGLILSISWYRHELLQVDQLVRADRRSLHVVLPLLVAHKSSLFKMVDRLFAVLLKELYSRLWP